MIKRRIFLTIKGMGYLEGYGHPPGYVPLAFMALLGFVAGEFLGVCMMLAFFGPFFLAGCYERAAEWESQTIKRDLKVLSNED